MIERLIFNALTEGIEELTEHPKRLVRFFRQNCDLSKAEAEAIRTQFLAKPPTVIHSYPRTDESRFPLFAIALGEENESDKFLNDDGGMVTLDDLEVLGNDAEDVGADILTSVYTFQHNILVMTLHPDLTIYYYQLAKYFLTRKRPYFKDVGLLDMALGGADMAPDPRYVPEHIFVRRLTMSSKAEQSIVGERIPRARRVAGIHVDDGSPREDLGGVRALVGTFEPDSITDESEDGDDE